MQTHASQIQYTVFRCNSTPPHSCFELHYTQNARESERVCNVQMEQAETKRTEPINQRSITLQFYKCFSHDTVFLFFYEAAAA